MSKKKDEGADFGAEMELDEDALAVLSGNDEIEVELSEKEKLKLEAEARREVAEAIKAAKAKEFKAAAKKRIQSEAMFRNGKDDGGEDLDTVELTLASHPKFIILDGAVYHSGKKYSKKRSVIAVLKDQMDRGWRQEAARLGEKTEWVEQKQKLLTRNGLMMH